MALLAFFAANIVGLFAFFAFILLYIPPCSLSHTSFKQLEPVALANCVIHVHMNISMEEIYADFYTINDAMDKILATQHAHPHHYSKPMTSILTDAALAQVALHDALTDLWEMPATARTRWGIGESIGRFVGGAFGLATTSDLNTVVDQLNGVSDAYNHAVEALEQDKTRLAAEAHNVFLLNRSLHMVETVLGKVRSGVSSLPSSSTFLHRKRLCTTASRRPRTQLNIFSRGRPAVT